jgi:SAM-dependent methyltransferase
MIENIKYVHHPNVYNFEAAKEIVPYLVGLLNPKSVVDVGCGIGTWLKVFLDHNVEDYIGIDGEYVDRSLLEINDSFFISYDLEKYYLCDRKFDLVISLEVAEHLKEDSADDFISTLTNLSDVVVFSAAIPNQGGQNHINEQDPKYWITKFEEKGFECFDILRPLFWNNNKVDCWYKQNIFLFTKKEVLKNKLKNFETFNKFHLVHPDLLKIKEGELLAIKNNHQLIVNGKKEKRFYWNLFITMVKSLSFKD